MHYASSTSPTGLPADDMDWTTQKEDVIEGCGRFLDRVWRLVVEERDVVWRDGDVSEPDLELARATHRCIAKVTDEIERWSFNTAVATCREFASTLQRYRSETRGRPAPRLL